MTSIETKILAEIQNAFYYGTLEFRENILYSDNPPNSNLPPLSTPISFTAIHENLLEIIPEIKTLTFGETFPFIKSTLLSFNK